MSDRLRQMLAAFKAGEIDEDEMIQRIVRQPFEEHLIGKRSLLSLLRSREHEEDHDG